METQNYEYLPLSTLSEGLLPIRLLHLLPAIDRGSILQCHLVESEIPDYLPKFVSKIWQSRPVCRTEYHALSYSWGDPVFSYTLEVLGHTDGDPIGIIGITENLHSALQHLRKADKTLVLWVDAVCINQSNIPERNSQVSNMAQTYTQSTSVIVWLGPESAIQDGLLCLDFFSKLAQIKTIRNEDGDPDTGHWRTRFTINQAVSAFLDSMRPNPVTHFLNRSWFRRRWVIQEVVLANQVFLHCGSRCVPWNYLENAMLELCGEDIGGFDPDYRTTMRAMSRIRRAASGTKFQVPLDTLVEFSSFICSDPRDRLYALQGVIQYWFPVGKQSQETGIVNYALSTEEVFTDFSVFMMRLDYSPIIEETYQSITHVFQLATAFQHEVSTELGKSTQQHRERLPSWVVDWTGNLSFEPLSHSPQDRDASSGIPKLQVEILPPENGERLLVTIGIPYDIITASVSLDPAPLLLTGAVHEAKKAMNKFLCHIATEMGRTNFSCGPDMNTYVPTGQHIISAIATSIIANWEHTQPNSYFAQNPRFRTDFLDQLGSGYYLLPEILHKWPAYVELVATTMRGRALFLTRSGYIGISINKVETGDLVCLLSDIKVPFVLRPRGGMAEIGENGQVDIIGCQKYRGGISKLTDGKFDHITFQLVSDAYVHGLMEGEALEKMGTSLGDCIRILPIA